MNEDRNPRAGAYLTLGLLSLVYMFNYIDRQIVAILAQSIKQDLSLSDSEIGLLSGLSFALVYSTFGIPAGWLADRANRVKVISFSCALWSIGTAVCGLANSFAQLLLARASVGLGEAGGVPPSYSLISDNFPPRQRGMAIAIYSLGLPVGATLGLGLGAWIATIFGWRGAFLAAGLPGILLAALVYFMVKEPPRGEFDGAQLPRTSSGTFRETLRTFRRSRLLLMLLLSCAGCSMAFNAFGAWAPSLLMRAKGMSLEQVATHYSLVMGGALAVGMIASGALTRWAGDRIHFYALVPAAGILLALPCFVLGAASSGWSSALPLLAIPMAANVIPLAPTMAILQNFVTANQRSMASAIALLVYNLVGTGFGPLYTGAISDFLLPQYGDQSLEIAFYFIIPIFVFAALTLFAMAYLLKPERQTLRRA
ncbi:MFS transporter [Qipengyuania gaetbuli]|uniref:spinster family MFS transporter n=1 Tax=Qipengyuania gaetbuli TaxID=266952 RepID=UPI001C99441A|nr:MFS transporter [Qipengyuania gaetbuli]MBY6013542.1 MFS transporter [Qipengyuania gaetbuli]